MTDRKFSRNDQQIRAEAIQIANSNAPQGTPTELILAEAEKVREYIDVGLLEDNNLGQTVQRVITVKRLRQEQEMRKEEARLEREAQKLDEEADSGVDDSTVRCDCQEYPCEHMRPRYIPSNESFTPEKIQEMRQEAIDRGDTPEDIGQPEPDAEMLVDADPPVQSSSPAERGEDR